MKTSLVVLAGALAVFNPPVHAQTNISPAQKPGASKAKPFSVQVVGHGKPMILIPGLTCGANVWDSTVDHFKDHYECHVLTVAGFAGEPPIGAPMMETVRKGIAGYIHEKKLDHPVIVGHSLGGFLSFWLASSEPSLVGPVISVDGGTFFPALMDTNATPESAKPNAEMMQQLIEGQTQEEFAEGNKRFFATMVTDPKNLDLIAPTCAKSDPKAVALALYELMTIDLRGDVARIKTPVLLVGALGAAPDEMKPDMKARYEAQVAKIPKHKVVYAEKAKHFVMLDDPKFLFASMDEFLVGFKAE